MKPITNLRLRLGLDAICWVGATIALLWYQYPTIAALVGAFGIVYLYRMIGRYRMMAAQFKMMEALQHFMMTGEQPTDPNLTIEVRRFESEEDFIDYITNKDDDEHPNP